MDRDVILEARGLTKSFGPTHAMRGIDLDVLRGEVLAIMGPSGSGKSTLLHTLAAIEAPDQGTVTLNGARIDSLPDAERTILRRTKFGFVFQFGQLVPELSALENVMVPLMLGGVRKNDAERRAREWLARVGLSDRADALPGQLSGGEAQRVAIARALIITPEVLFADEPTGALDSFASEQVMEMIVSLARAEGLTVVMVTHEPMIAAYADREVVVRDGRIEGQ
ncbi:ABC transporter ATP-binding protein [Trueperella bernardiae]|uniref:ABC transporter ATP-binding protein n=1 Tax=Trueperella bernardiae TaxID=59561 RepID=A0A0W1KJ25_9ACTO|nr:ABC transporter ATP-binding protein [Trueperella bernardiae]KTF03731.1 Lipoprotein-releasing system ATP-binding protein LolD [Trueperella bernardiae]MCM3907393.1 ABC transporter ATP-binding protein [Trueperella bernardiae]MDK8601629.1 ABC transporter ATP-binding protein [Trueperella bernardiae]OCW61248.1 macrolide ABC transporter ATP-binding protein [Trueperella bernardiae]PKZ89614.1 ABC transporter ATP-binding protein [Trueperella bernardiae]